MAKTLRIRAKGIVFSEYVRAGYPLLVAPNPQIGISVARRLRPDYTGPLIEVVRSSDLTTAAIGVDSAGLLDEVALLAFCGSGDGYVSTAYNQGVGPNYARSVNDGRPKIVEAGVVVKRNGRPAMKFAGAQYLGATHAAMHFNVSTATVLVVGETTDPPSNAAHFFMVPVNGTGSGIRYSLSKSSATETLQARGRRMDGETEVAAGLPNVPNEFAQITGKWNFVTRELQLLRNDESSPVVLMSVAGATPASGASGAVAIGAAAFNSSSGLEGYVSEVVAYTTDVSAQLDALRKNQRVFYSIA